MNTKLIALAVAGAIAACSPTAYAARQTLIVSGPVTPDGVLDGVDTIGAVTLTVNANHRPLQARRTRKQ